jgi:putative DNA methylase
MTENVKTRKKLIEVALPLEAINTASAREKSIRHGHPSTLHLWWARRPLAAARAVIFSQLVDDPSAMPEEFPTKEAQDKERERLFKIIENLVLWENTTNETVIDAARTEIWRSWKRACADNKSHPQANELFNPDKLPAFHDPFAGGGALPLEAQRLGLEAYASDLNPVAVLICKAMIEIPPKFAGQPPVNPEARKKIGHSGSWKGAAGLAEDVRYYGKWMRDEAEKRIGHLYPKVEITQETVRERPDLKPYLGQKLTVIAWLWARTVKSPNPAFASVDVPLAASFILSTKAGKEAYVEPIIKGKDYHFEVKIGKPKNEDVVRRGTKSGSSGSNFLCLLSGVPIPFEYLRSEAKQGRMGQRLMAIVAEGPIGRVYLSPTLEIEEVAKKAKPVDVPDTELPKKALGFRIQEYGMTRWRDMFTPRQLVVLTTLSNLVTETHGKLYQDALSAGIADDSLSLDNCGNKATAYADAVSIYLAFLVGQVANHSSSFCGWNSANSQMRSVFARQAIPMVWDYAESNPFCDSSGSYNNLFERQIKGFITLGEGLAGTASQEEATNQKTSKNKLISTDPPYYDNIGYADLSDFFYLWLRRSLKTIYPSLFTTLAVPKVEELIASPYRNGGKTNAEKFFLEGMTKAMHRLAETGHDVMPITIYYAFKQAESNGEAEITNTGWSTFLEAIIESGLAITGTWPIRTEKQGRSVGIETNSLASSIVIVCRPKIASAKTITRREFLEALKAEMQNALANLQRGNIAPVDLQQAILGPGMAVYTRYTAILDAEGAKLTVSGAISIILQALDEVLAEQEGDFDGDTRWALVWFDQYGFKEAEYGIAETLSKSKNTSVEGMRSAGIIESGHGKVRLLKASELPEDWDPTKDKRLTVWEMVHHLIRLLETSEQAAAELLAKLGSKAEPARELAYRLFTISERRKRSADAIAYNSLVQAWPEIVRLAQEVQQSQPRQTRFDV